MQLSTKLAAAIAILVAIAVGFVIWRRNAGRSHAQKASSFRGPASMRFTCAGCSGQFPHTKRTVAAWEKGSRRVFCDACHKKWRNARPPEDHSASRNDGAVHRPPEVRSAPPNDAAVQRPAAGSFTPVRPASTYASNKTGRSGCLGLMLFFILVPAVLLAFVAND